MTRDTATKARYKGAALHTCCKSFPGRAGPTHSPEPHNGRDTGFARNAHGEGNVGVTESTAVISRRDKGNTVPPWAPGAERLTKQAIAVKQSHLAVM